MVHPDDDNGDALRRLEANGDDLTRPRDVDFTVVFPDQDSGEKFANHFRALGYRASVELSETVEAFPWDVVVIKHMAPSHKEIEDFEILLQSVAALFAGRNDGWGCFSVVGPQSCDETVKFQEMVYRSLSGHSLHLWDQRPALHSSGALGAEVDFA
jgi:hypothetical protein